MPDPGEGAHGSPTRAIVGARVAHPGCARIAASRSAHKEEADGALTGRVRRRAARGSSGNAPLAPPPVVPNDLPGGAFPGPAPGRHPAAGVLLPRHAPARGVEDHLRRWLHADLRGPRAPARPDSARRRGGRRGHGGRQDDRPRVSLHQARRGAGARPPRPAPGDHRPAVLRRRDAGGLRRPLRPIAGPRSPRAYGANDSKYFIVTIWLFGESCLTSLTQRSRFAGSPNVSRRSRGGALNGASKLSQWVGRTIFG